MKKYLIIGGAGFIGRHLALALLENGNAVVVVDIKRVTFPKIVSYNMDAEDVKSIDRLFKKEKPDVVFYLAGAMHLRRLPGDPLFSQDIDFLSRLRVAVDACHAYRVKKIVFVSSGGAIYENADVIPTPETYRASPTSLYGLANLMSESFLAACCENYGISFTITRLGNVYGPGQWESGFLPSVIKKMLNSERPVLYGLGLQTRDFIYISDVVDALILLAQHGKNEAYNVGSGKELSLKKTFELVKKILKKNITVQYQSPNRLFETQRSALNIKKMQKEFGWSPKTSLEAGIQKTIEWYKNNGK